MSPRLKQYIAAALLCLFMVYITPKEVWHLFASHHDTTHTASSHTGYPLTLSAAHHHCELMKADQHFSAHEVSLLGLNVIPASIVWCQQPLAIYQLLPFCKGMGGRGLRAPPVVC
jgi:hypothetical protein